MRNITSAVCLFILFNLIALQLPAQNYWAGFNEVQYDGKHFYAVANQLYQIVKLNKKGKVIDKFGSRGKGPAEFSSEKLKLLLRGDHLIVLDGKGFTLTILDKKTFELVRRNVLKKPPSGLISFDRKLYGYVNVVQEMDSLNKEVKAFRPFGDLKDSASNLFKIKIKNPYNPFYDSELITSGNEGVVVAREGKSEFIFFSDSLVRRQIPFIENVAAGKKITRDTQFLQRPGMKIFWKKKIMPKYELIKALSLDSGNVYFQVHSYKIGNALIRYNLSEDRFDRIGGLSQGRLIAVSGDTVYTLNDNKIKRTTIPRIRSCSENEIIFYLSADAFGEQCTSCSDSFFDWYSYAKHHNIPVKLVLEDDSWFGKKGIEDIPLEKIKQWNLWGTIKYQKECRNCFDSFIKVRIKTSTKSSKVYAFPKNISVLKNRIDCKAFRWQ